MSGKGEVVEMRQAGALATGQNSGRMAVADIIQHVALVQEVMRAVMKEGVHYGKIPGTDKPTLFKSGAEVLCMTFRIADTYEVEDLSTPDMIRYRVNCIGTHQTTGVVLGSGLGEASSSEEKYKWRKSVSPEEFESTPANMRRVKHARGRNNTTYKQEQVRTEPADLANTVLKMANKRAKMAMTLNVTAASDCFAQDLEDMDDALRDHLTRHEDDVPAQPAQPTKGTLPACPVDQFSKRLPVWQKNVDDGGNIADLLAMLQSKYTLMPEQISAINALAKPAEPALNSEQSEFASQP